MRCKVNTGDMESNVPMKYSTDIILAVNFC